MAGKPVATLGSMHVCPMVNGTVPHVGGPVTQGDPMVLINGKPAATIGSMCVCVGPPDVIAQGAPNVLVNGKPIATLGSMTAHGGTITVGDPTVLVAPAGTAATAPPLQLTFPKVTIAQRTVTYATSNGKQLKIAEENQEALRQASEQQAPPEAPAFIVSVQAMYKEHSVSETHIKQILVLTAQTINIPNGEQITLTITKGMLGQTSSNDTSNQEDEVLEEIQAMVQDNVAQVEWEVPDFEEEEIQ